VKSQYRERIDSVARSEVGVTSLGPKSKFKSAIKGQSNDSVGVKARRIVGDMEGEARCTRIDL